MKVCLHLSFLIFSFILVYFVDLKAPATTTAMTGTTTATAAVSVIFGFCSPGYSCMCVSVKTPYNP